MIQTGPYSSLYMLDPPPEMRAMVSVRSGFAERFGLEEARALVAAAQACTAPMSMSQIRVLGGATAAVGRDETAFAHRDSRFMVTFLAMYGGGAEEITAQERWVQDALAAVVPAGSAAYVNFLGSPEAATGATAYPAPTRERLARVKRVYDPQNLFRLNTNIAPAA
jgi:FAD/FMN-containing dehydrogenase